MDKRALVLVVLVLLTCAGAVSASAAGIERGKAALTLGGTDLMTFPPIHVPTGGSFKDRVLLQLPTSFTPTAVRVDWSRFFSWINPTTTP